MNEQQHMNWNKIISKIVEYKWWLIFGTIATILAFSIYANFNIGWKEDSRWWLYVVLITGAFLGELFTKPVDYQFILKTVYFSIFQSFLWLFIWATYLVASGKMYEPSPLPKILIIPWTLYFSMIFIFPSNFAGSLIAYGSKKSIKKHHLRKKKEK